MQPNFVVSLDFEQAWGMVASKAYGSERASIVGARKAVPAILEIAARYGVRCTWATVGLLFFDDRDELLNSLPEIRPNYKDPALSPYHRIHEVGRNEKEDGLHFGRSMISLVRDCPGQELASHTFSHYYCLEDGDDALAFEADLAAARNAAASLGVELKSIVFPRNQLRQSYLSVCNAAGYRCYRGNQRSHLHQARPRTDERSWSRLVRGADAYVPLMQTAEVNHPRRDGNMIDVAASRFLRPASSSAFLNHVQLRRIKNEMTNAAKQGGVFHLWWHPQNFGCNTDLNLFMLAAIFEHFRRLANDYGMVSKTMNALAEEAITKEFVHAS